MIKEWRSTNT